MIESQEKVSEKSGNFEMDIEWQPCKSPRVFFPIGAHMNHGFSLSGFAPLFTSTLG